MATKHGFEPAGVGLIKEKSSPKEKIDFLQMVALLICFIILYTRHNKKKKKKDEKGTIRTKMKESSSDGGRVEATIPVHPPHPTPLRKVCPISIKNLKMLFWWGDIRHAFKSLATIIF